MGGRRLHPPCQSLPRKKRFPAPGQDVNPGPDARRPRPPLAHAPPLCRARWSLERRRSSRPFGHEPGTPPGCVGREPLYSARCPRRPSTRPAPTRATRAGRRRSPGSSWSSRPAGRLRSWSRWRTARSSSGGTTPRSSITPIRGSRAATPPSASTPAASWSRTSAAATAPRRTARPSRPTCPARSRASSAPASRCSCRCATSGPCGEMVCASRVSGSWVPPCKRPRGPWSRRRAGGRRSTSAARAAPARRGWRAPSTRRGRARAGPSSPSTARPSPRAWPSGSSSAPSAARSPARTPTPTATCRRRTAARSSSTRWPSSRSRCRRSCCA